MAECEKIPDKATDTQTEPKDYIKLREQIYETLMDVLTPEYRLPGVENLFAPGKPCEQKITAICWKPMSGSVNGLALKMFDYGVLYEKCRSSASAEKILTI